MTSVDGYTKAGADAAFASIAHTHDGAGSGIAFSQTLIRVPTSVTPMSSVAGKGVKLGNWSVFNNYYGSGISLSQTAEGFDFVDEGIYQLDILLWAGFASGTLPDFVRVDIVTWDGYNASWDVACTPGQSDTIPSMSSRSFYGAQATLSTGFFHTPGAAVTGGGDGIIITTAWPGDSDIQGGNGGGSDAALALIANRIA